MEARRAGSQLERVVVAVPSGTPPRLDRARFAIVGAKGRGLSALKKSSTVMGMTARNRRFDFEFNDHANAGGLKDLTQLAQRPQSSSCTLQGPSVPRSPCIG